VSASLSALKQRASQDPALGRMGSTVVAAVLKGRNIYLINVGDSRAYLVNKQQVRQISYDHSLVGEQLRQGIITEADVRHHPRRNVLSMSISAQREDITTYTNMYEWQSGDRLVLCSDGLWGPVTEPQIQAVVLEYGPQQAAERLVYLANANQGPDNISVIVASFQ
jgi:serine/threonine protein phosphatase PrpC